MLKYAKIFTEKGGMYCMEDLNKAEMIKEAKKKDLKTELLLRGGHKLEGKITKIAKGVVHVCLDSANSQSYIGHATINDVVGVISREK